MISQRLTLLALMTAGLTLLPGVRAQNAGEAESWDPAALYEQSRTLFDQLAPDVIRNHFEMPSLEEWNGYWRTIETALQSDSLEDLAWLYPLVDNGLGLMQQTPATQPYAAWLQQRADYFDMANLVMNVIPGPVPASPPVRPTPGKLSMPPRPAPAPAASPAVTRGRQRYVQSQQSWDKKLKGRPAPSGAAALVPRCKKVFAEEGVPVQWVWQAEVESSFNPEARSPVGALGLYQFMPATAGRFGLQLEPQDERRIPEKSARAAAKYLKILHKQFGSWPLAFAAYNAGEGRVARLLKKTDGPKTFEGIQGRLPLETQMYVPKIMAVVALREGIDPSTLPPPVLAWEFYPPIVVTARLSP